MGNFEARLYCISLVVLFVYWKSARSELISCMHTFQENDE